MAKWRIVFAGADFESRARLAEREGSTLWIRGSLIRAERRLAQAVARYCGASSVVSDQTQAVLAEAYARTLVHMRRSPDTRLLVRRHIVQQAEHALQHAEHRVRGHEGVHLKARLATARSLLTGDDDPLHADHAPAFSESESLHGWFNFRHSEKRYRFEHDGIRPEADDLRDLLRAQVEVGSYGDAARVLLLPGAEYAFSPRDFVKTWSRIDVTRGIVFASSPSSSSAGFAPRYPAPSRRSDLGYQEHRSRVTAPSSVIAGFGRRKGLSCHSPRRSPTPFMTVPTPAVTEASAPQDCVSGDTGKWKAPTASPTSATVIAAPWTICPSPLKMRGCLRSGGFLA